MTSSGNTIVLVHEGIETEYESLQAAYDSAVVGDAIVVTRADPLLSGEERCDL